LAETLAEKVLRVELREDALEMCVYARCQLHRIVTLGAECFGWCIRFIHSVGAN
jgi:hypothetical protein